LSCDFHYNCTISFFYLYLIFHICVQKFNVMFLKKNSYYYYSRVTSSFFFYGQCFTDLTRVHSQPTTGVKLKVPFNSCTHLSFANSYATKRNVTHTPRLTRGVDYSSTYVLTLCLKINQLLELVLFRF
jgi:hypothetical protein